jgi:hypothetical protein
MDEHNQHSTAALSAEDFTEQRAASRDSLLLIAQFRVADELQGQVRVRNLSAGGLMAEHAEPLARGTPVAVEVRGVGWVSGRAAWSAEGRVGVAFDHAIDPRMARQPPANGTAAFATPAAKRR